MIYVLKLEYALNAQWTIINRINGFSILGITEINGNNNINALFTLNKSTNDFEGLLYYLRRFNNSVFKAYCYIESCRIIYFDRYILRFNEMIESCRIIHGLFYILLCSYFYSTFTGFSIIMELLIEEFLIHLLIIELISIPIQILKNEKE